MRKLPIQKNRTDGLTPAGAVVEKTQQVKEFYNKIFWRDYDEHMRRTNHYAVMEKILDRVVYRIPGSPAKILDPACGTGHPIEYLFSKRGDLRFVANDISSEMLSIAKHKLGNYGPENVTFTQSDVQKLPYRDGTFEIILLTYGMHWFADKAGVANELYRVLKDKGTLISIEEWPLLVTPTKYSAKFRDSLMETVTPISMGEMNKIFCEASLVEAEHSFLPINLKHDMHCQVYAKR